MTRTQRNLLNIGINEFDEVKRPWPEVEFLFGEDENYQEIVSEIMQNVTASITKVTKYIEVLKLRIFFDFINNFLIQNKLIELSKLLRSNHGHNKIEHRKLNQASKHWPR